MTSEFSLELPFLGDSFWAEQHARLLLSDRGRGDRFGRALRRTRVAELVAEGYGEQAVADDMGMSLRQVGRDVAWVKRVLRPDEDLEAAA